MTWKKKWVAEQKELLDGKILEKIEKGKNQAKYTQKCLQLCKGWKGPVTTIEELHNILKAFPDIKEKIVRTELTYYRDTHRSDAIQQPDMYKINSISHEERLMNLCALLSDSDNLGSHVTLPTNIDLARALNQTVESSSETELNEIVVRRYYVTLFVEGTKNTWYLSSCEKQNEDGTYEMHHLERVKAKSDLAWKHPKKIDRTDLLEASIVNCEIDGECDVLKERNMIFTLKNHIFISKLVDSIESVGQ